MELTTINILSLFETTKKQRLDFIANLMSRVYDGEIDIIKVHSYLKSMEDITGTLFDSKEYKLILLDAAYKVGKKFQMYNADFQISEAGVKYDYSMCGDEVLENLVAKQISLTEQIKLRQLHLKSLPPGGAEHVNIDTGEMTILYPPSKSSTTIVKTTLK